MQHWKSKLFRELPSVYTKSPPATTVNIRINVIKKTFINDKEDHQIQHQWFCMPYIYNIRLSKHAGYYLKNLQKSPMLYLLLLNNIQQGGLMR